jgi:hypothetical protein
MPRLVRVSALFLSAFAFLVCGCAGHKPSEAKRADGSWRSLPLVSGGKIDPSWTHVGWGGFVVEDGMLKTAPDERGLGMLLYKKEKLGDCQLRVVFKSERPQANAGVFVRLDDGILRHLDEKSYPAKRDPAGKLSEESMKGTKSRSPTTATPTTAPGRCTRWPRQASTRRPRPRASGGRCSSR